MSKKDLIGERSYSNRDSRNPRVLRVSEYEAAFNRGDGVVDVIIVYTQHNYGGGYWGFLQIQKTGLGASMESIKFLDGKPFNHISHSIDGLMLEGEQNDLSEASDERLEPILKRFGAEFKPVFHDNKYLQKYLSTHFTALESYLK